MSELRGVERAFKPFYFHERDSGADIRGENYFRARCSPVKPAQSASLPNSPLNTPAVFEEEQVDLHHSVPNMHFNFDPRKEPSINEMETMHHSMPNIYFDSTSVDREMDPIPVNLAVPELSVKPAAVTSSPDNDEPMTISSSLIESLAKITESVGVDENPYEPIPLSPASKRRSSIVIAKDDFPNITEHSVSDAFEEE